MATLKLSARNAGQVELETYCPRCAWYLLRLKKLPFQMGMPGVMFYLEAVEKAFILTYLQKHKHLPKGFGLFSNCTEPVTFPFSMEAMHETGVLVTARPDMMLYNKDETIALIDLKTARADGGGAKFHPQYHIQLIGYSWVTEAVEIGEVGSAGLIFCEIQHEFFKTDPLSHMTDTGITVPFNFRATEVELDYPRFAKCLVEMKKVWESPRPAKGATGCKDCALFNR